MSKSRKKNQKLAQFWKQHIKKWSESGLSQNEYCRQNNLKPNRFTYWKSKFKNQALVPEFVELPSTQIDQILNFCEQKGLRLNIGDRFQIEIPEGFSQTTLTQVLQVLEGC